ncbi:MAG: hypothetical protein HY043_01860 [Verrucomicrobia bacterium]|nr:hypothetical protein [Verrucomicrobiota bacterium]
MSQWLCCPEFEARKNHVELAILMMGKDTVPVLRKHLRRGSRYERICYQNTPLWIRSHWPSHWSLYNIRERALSALEVVGRDAQSAAPELIAMISDTSEFPQLRREAMRLAVLSRVDPGLLIPIFKRLINDSDFTIRQTAGGLAYQLQKEQESKTEYNFTAKLKQPHAGDGSNTFSSELVAKSLEATLKLGLEKR